MATVGTIVVAIGFPVSIHCSLRALREARDKRFAVASLVISLGGLVFLIGWVVMGITARQPVTP